MYISSYSSHIPSLPSSPFPLLSFSLLGGILEKSFYLIIIRNAKGLSFYATCKTTRLPVEILGILTANMFTLVSSMLVLEQRHYLSCLLSTQSSLSSWITLFILHQSFLFLSFFSLLTLLFFLLCPRSPSYHDPTPQLQLFAFDTYQHFMPTCSIIGWLISIPLLPAELLNIHQQVEQNKVLISYHLRKNVYCRSGAMVSYLLTQIMEDPVLHFQKNQFSFASNPCLQKCQGF